MARTITEEVIMNNSAPIIGAALVVGFIVIIVLCVLADSKSKKKFMNMIQETYKIKDKSGQIIITSNNEIMFSVPSGTLPGYKKFALEDIAYVGFYVNRGQKSFSFLDSNKKAMKGEYLTPSKKPLLQKGMAAFPMSSGEQDQMFEFAKKYKSDVIKIVNGNVSE